MRTITSRADITSRYSNQNHNENTTVSCVLMPPFGEDKKEGNQSWGNKTPTFYC